MPTYSSVLEQIDTKKSVLKKVSHDIWLHPELKYEEKYAHRVLTDELEKQGFQVQRNYFLETAFRAEFCGKGGDKPVVAVLCEYDALPEIGHACGHNLIAESGFAAGIGVKAFFESNPSVSGKVVVLGTPAEEGGGGKVDLIRAGAFKDVDACIMAHPSPVNDLYPLFLGIIRVCTIQIYYTVIPGITNSHKEIPVITKVDFDHFTMKPVKFPIITKKNLVK